MVSGRRLTVSLLASIGAATVVGIVSYYGLTRTMGIVLGSATPQIVTLAVYVTLVAVLCYSFRPPSRPPIAAALYERQGSCVRYRCNHRPHCGLCARYAFLGFLGEALSIFSNN